MAKRVQESTTAEKVQAAPRVSLTLDESGTKIAWDRVRPSTRAQVAELLRDPDTRVQLGLNDLAATAAPALAAPAFALSEAQCGFLLDALGRFEMDVAKRVYRCSDEQARVLLFTGDEKRTIAEPLAKVLGKYSGTWLTQYGDEITLAALLVTTIGGKWTALADDLKAPAPVYEFPRKTDDSEKSSEELSKDR